MGSMDAMTMSPYGDTMYNAGGDDDDCKYHVTWTATPVCQGPDVTFSLELVAIADGSPASGANPRLEAFLNETHPALDTDEQSRETSAGNYSVGAVQFDASGRWTVRFHFFETCSDGPDSPHGHAAFYVDVA